MMVPGEVPVHYSACDLGLGAYTAQPFKRYAVQTQGLKNPNPETLSHKP